MGTATGTATYDCPVRLGGYDVLAELDAGGMGEVLLARRRAAGGFERLVALKTLRRELTDRAGLREMFLDEARLVARLHHPGIAQVHDFGEDGDRLFLAMEYVGGINFDELAARTPPPAIGCLAMAEALRALEAAHELRDHDGAALGVVHRDVSPGNLMLTYAGTVKVLDFGIALARNRQAPVTEFGGLKGKPPYMAPEQLKGEAVDRRTDVFSAAAVLWELLCGERLHGGDSIFAIARAIEHDRPEPPSRRRPDLPAGLDEAVLRGLAKRPDDRHPTALSFAEELDRIAREAGAEPLVDYARRELEADRQAHERYLANLMRSAGDGAARRGRKTGVQTVPAIGEPAREPVEDPGPEAPATGERRRLWPLAVVLALLASGIGGAIWTLTERAAPLLALAPATAATLPDDAAPAPRDAAPSAPADAATPAPPDAGRPAPAPAPATRRAPPRRRDAGRSAPKPPVDAAPAAPAAVGFGRLSVLDEQPYYRIQLDGRTLETTPFYGKNVRAGPHTLTWIDPATNEIRFRRSIVIERDRLAKFRAGRRLD
jgi:serine/threonine-protein kinase